jgi:hypothetical protein
MPRLRRLLEALAASEASVNALTKTRKAVILYHRSHHSQTETTLRAKCQSSRASQKYYANQYPDHRHNRYLRRRLTTSHTLPHLSQPQPNPISRNPLSIQSMTAPPAMANGGRSASGKNLSTSSHHEPHSLSPILRTRCPFLPSVHIQ